jgi:hypothetical protein
MGGRLAAIHMGENDVDISAQAVEIYNNTFELGPSGNGVVVSSASGVTIENNTVTCLNNDCSSVGYFARTDGVGTYGATGTEMSVKNNTVDVLTSAGKPAVMVCGPPGNVAYQCSTNATVNTTSAMVCNTGTAVGNGTITTNQPPCP